MSTVEQQEIAVLKQRIYRLESQVNQLYQHLNLTFVENINANDDPKIIAALKSNNIIEAVKLYREKTGVGLEAAKSAVDEMRGRLGL
ncbi:MAG: hypothetical protein ACOYZ8_01610 [Chloroflexota bacterium]